MLVTQLGSADPDLYTGCPPTTLRRPDSGSEWQPQPGCQESRYLRPLCCPCFSSERAPRPLLWLLQTHCEAVLLGLGVQAGSLMRGRGLLSQAGAQGSTIHSLLWAL